MTVAVPTLIKIAFAINGDRNVIPFAFSGIPGSACYDIGFGPETRTDPNEGGVPPIGRDFQGFFYDVSGNIAWLTGGMGYSWNSAFSTQNGGYAVGAVLKSASDSTKWYYNRSAGNTNDPDAAIAGWTAFSLIASPTAVQTIVAASGTTNNLSISAGVGLLTLDTTAGDATITGIPPEFDGQILIVRNGGPNLVILPPDDAGSAAGAQWRLPTGGLALIAGQTKCFKNFAGLPGWVAL